MELNYFITEDDDDDLLFNIQSTQVINADIAIVVCIHTHHLDHIVTIISHKITNGHTNKIWTDISICSHSIYRQGKGSHISMCHIYNMYRLIDFLFQAVSFFGI